MTGRQLVRLAAALAVALALWGAFAFMRHARRDRAGGLALSGVDTAAVDTMAFVRGADSAIVVRGSGGRWRVNGFPADSSMVAQTLAAVADTANWSELAAESRASQAAMGVGADSGRRVRVVTTRGPGLDLIAGHQTTDNAAVFVRRPADSAVYALHGPLAQAFGHSLTEWRDKTVASIAPQAVQRMEVEHGKAAYALLRDAKGWKFASGERADSQVVEQLLERYHPLSAIGFANAAQADSLRTARPAARVRLIGGGNAALATLLIDSTKTDTWVRADSGSTLFQLGSWRLSQLVPAMKSLAAGAPKPH